MKGTIMRRVLIAVVLVVAIVAVVITVQMRAAADKVTICHHASDTMTVDITVDQDALSAHMAHGDTMGACPVSPKG
jgi:hypothetical protein